MANVNRNKANCKNINDRKTDKCGHIDLNWYATIILKKYKQSILNARKKLGSASPQILFDDRPIRAENVDDIEKLATRRGRSKIFWYGLIYQICEILPNKIIGKSYGGMTTLTLYERWHLAIKDSMEKPETWHYPLINKIREFLFFELSLDIESLKIGGKWNWKKIHAILDRRFMRKVKIICFNDKSLRNEEKNFIRENNLIDDGLNILKGGEGGPAIDLPMLSIAKYIAMGKTITDIHDLITKEHDIQYTLQTVRARIIDYWESFTRAQIMFLRPILEILIRIRFELYEINEAYGRFMLERIKLFFGGKSYCKLLKMDDKDWSSLRISKQFPLWTNAGRIKSIIPVEILKFLIRRYLYATEAINDDKVISFLSVYNSSDVKRQNIVYQVQQQLDYKNWNEAREFITIPYLIKKLRENRSAPKHIYMAIGYKEGSANTHNTLSRAILFGLTTLEVKNFLNKYPSINSYEDFEKFLSIEKKNRTQLNKKMIDDLLLKYTRSNDMIEGLMGWFSGDFLNEVRKYYKNFKLAKWIVKASYVIKEIKNLPINFSMEDISQLLIKIGYSEESEPPAVFRDMFFGMSVSQTVSFIKLHPWIETYEEAKRVYMEENEIDRIIPRGTRYTDNNRFNTL